MKRKKKGSQGEETSSTGGVGRGRFGLVGPRDVQEGKRMWGDGKLWVDL